MPANLHALIRYRTIDRCLRNREYDYNWEKLAKECTNALIEEGLYEHRDRSKVISRRTIFYDIQTMKSGKLGYYAPIEYDSTDKTYYYTDSKFSIQNVPLKREELGELQNALLILKQFSGKSNMTALENIITKLEETLNLKKSVKNREIIRFDHSLNEKGQKWLNQIYQAIKNKKALNIEYQPFNQDKLLIILSPYLLKEYNNRWYVFGKPMSRPDETYKIINLALDRVKSCKDSIQEYAEDSNFNPVTYLKDIIGVSLPVDVPKQTIVFCSIGTQSDYIKTKPIHESQKLVEETPEYCRFSIEVIPNYELGSTFLAFGEKVIVEQPADLSKILKKRIEASMKNYKSGFQEPGIEEDLSPGP